MDVQQKLSSDVSFWKRTFSRDSFLFTKEAAITLVGLAIFGFFTYKAPYFAQFGNVMDIARYSAFVAIVGVGWTFLIISEELDLSIGPAYSFCQVMCAWFIVGPGLDPMVAFFGAILVGAFIWATNGFIVTVLRVPSFVVTLGMLAVMMGASLTMTGHHPITVPRDTETILFGLANGKIGPFPAQFFWMVGVCLVGGFVLHKTKFGYQVFATGGNEKAARQAGINTKRVKFLCFVITGAMVGLCGALSVGWIRTTSPVGNQLFTIQVISAVIVGGAALSGGAGSVYGTVVAAFILGMLSTGLIMMGANVDVTFILFGSLIIVVGTLYIVIQQGQTVFITKLRQLIKGRDNINK